ASWFKKRRGGQSLQAGVEDALQARHAHRAARGQAAAGRAGALTEELDHVRMGASADALVAAEGADPHSGAAPAALGPALGAVGNRPAGAGVVAGAVVALALAAHVLGARQHVGAGAVGLPGLGHHAGAAGASAGEIAAHAVGAASGSALAAHHAGLSVGLAGRHASATG